MDSSGFRKILKVRALLIAALAATATISAASSAPATSLADDRVEASYNAGAQFVQDPQLDLLLAGIGSRIQNTNPDAMCVSLRIHALTLPLPYAFVLRNGAFYISTGLIARIRSEPEFAALIALPLAALCRGDAAKLSSDQRQRMLVNLVPNLLLVTLTGGLGAPSIANANAHKTEAERLQLRDASDAIALHWLVRAGFDPASAPLAMTHLLEGLAAEDRTGPPEFGNPTELASRHVALNQALAQDDLANAGVLVKLNAASAQEPYRSLSRRYALMQARADLDTHPTGVRPWLDYMDSLDGPSGDTAFLRAESARRNSGSDEGVRAAIAAYEKCILFADAPKAAYRELGFLYRRTGDVPRARDAFTKYLQQAPEPVDAAIIRTYLEVP